MSGNFLAMGLSGASAVEAELTDALSLCSLRSLSSTHPPVKNGSAFGLEHLNDSIEFVLIDRVADACV
jgi:hypothetical protein